MFGNLLGGKFSNKCKHAAKCITSRMVLVRKKKQATLRFLKGVVAELLSNGHDANAFGRIDALIVEINHAACYDMVEQFCQSIVDQLPVLQKQRECPEEAMEAVSTLIFAAARFPDLPELCDLRRVFTERYGSQMQSSVNTQFVEKMQKKSFSKEKKLQLMQDIAQEFSVRWDSKAFQQKISNPPAPSDQPKGVNGSSVCHLHGEINGRKEAVINNDHHLHGGINGRSEVTKGRKEAVINNEHHLHGSNNGRSEVTKEWREAVINNEHHLYGGMNGRSEVTKERKEAVINNEHHLYGGINGRSEFTVGRKEAVINTGVDPKIPSREGLEPPMTMQKQVRPEPRDIHVDHAIPIIRNHRIHEHYEKTKKKMYAANDEPENVEPHYSKAEVPAQVAQKVMQKRTHNDDWHDEGTFRNNTPKVQEGPGLIGLVSKSNEPAISRDVKAASMIPPYTNSKGLGNGSIAYDELCKAEDLDPTGQERKSFGLGNTKGGKFSNMAPPYTKPNYRKPSSFADDTKSTDVLTSNTSTADYDRSDGSVRPIPFSVRRKHPKPYEVVNTDNAVDDVQPVSQTSSGRRKEERHDGFDEENVIDQHSKQKVADEMNGDNNQYASRVPSGRRRHKGIRSAAIYDGDCDEEEKAMDRLLVHYSKKGIGNESSRTRTRMKVPPSELVVNSGRVSENQHHHHYNGNGRIHPGAESVRHPPERTASLPQEPASLVKQAFVKGPARTTSMQPDMLSPNGGKVHPRLPDYDDLAARFIALKRT